MYAAELVKTFFQMWRHPHFDPTDIAAFQNAKLRQLIRHAYRNVPYYHELFNGVGLKPDHVDSFEDLAPLPVTTSTDFRTRPITKIVSTGVNYKTLVSRNTSGSTGQPFVVRRSYWEDHLLNFFYIRAIRQHGVRISDRIVKIKLTSGANPSQGLKTVLPKAVRRYVAVYRDYLIDCLQPPEMIVRRLLQLNPDVVMGYTSIMSMLASIYPGVAKSTKRPRVVITGAESLFPFTRQIIEKGFGVRVFDIYGANECNLVAWECPVTGQYHICDDNVIVEILKEGRPVGEGESGEVVITCLHAYAMPFIRYSLGDIATRGAEVCSCGQPFSVITDIRGRLDDYFYLPGGRRMHPYSIDLPAIISQKDSFIRQYRLVQEKVNRVVLYIVPLRPPKDFEVDHIRRVAAKALGPKVDFSITFLEKLNREPSGKFRYRRSLVTPRNSV